MKHDGSERLTSLLLLTVTADQPLFRLSLCSFHVQGLLADIDLIQAAETVTADVADIIYIVYLI